MPPPQQQQQQEGGGGPGFFSRLSSRLAPNQYDRPSNSWQGQMAQQPQQQQGGGALVTAGPVRGPGGYQQQQQRPQEHEEGQGNLWERIKGKVFQGGPQDGVPAGPPSFRPHGSILAAKKAAKLGTAGGVGEGGYGMQGGYPFPGYPMGGVQGSGGLPSAGEDLAGPGKPEIYDIDNCVALVLKSNELQRKIRKFRQDGLNKMQVISNFDGTLTSFTAKDGKSNSLKTTELLEQNQHVMLPDAAKKIRYIRSEYKRRMEAEGKTMSPAERSKALETMMRQVFAVASQEGGIHMNSIGPAIESQLDKVPLREGANDMIAALLFRGIPITIFCSGYGHVCLEVLRRGVPAIMGPGGNYSPHLKLISNFFKSDETLTIIGMYDQVPLVHDGNKDGRTIMEFLKSSRNEGAIVSRPNAILMGTEMSDLELAKNIPGLEERISIGFLKLDEHLLEKLPRYASEFDIVILGDGDLSVVNEFLHDITSSIL